jgi:cytochrome P450
VSAVSGSGTLNLLRFGRDPLAYLDALHDDRRDIVPVTLGTQPVHLVTRPECIELALHNDDWPPLSRGRLMAFQRWCPGGLVTTSGAEHHRQRDEIWRPLARDVSILDIAVRRTRRCAESWVEGRPLDLFAELRSMCWAIDWEALCGDDLDGQPDMLAALRLGYDALVWLVLPFGTLRWSLPLPQSRRTRAARTVLDAAVTGMIAERRGRDGDAPDDLLTKLVRAADSDGSGVTDEQIRATFKIWFGTSLVFAHVAWTLLLLARAPDVEARWHEELDRVLGERPATVEDMGDLTYTGMLVKESLRLVPPSWAFFRHLTGDYALAGRVIPRGHIIAMSPWFTHRDARYWPDPLRFDPERFARGAPQAPRLAYFPFSSGPYGCHGPALATRQAVLILATLGQAWSFRRVGPEPAPVAAWAVEPRGGAIMTPRERGR